MDKLPPELLLKIARYCDYDEICTMSQVNRRWHEVIESNWNSLKNTIVQRIGIKDGPHGLDIFCAIHRRGQRREWLRLNVKQGVEIVDAAEPPEKYWNCGKKYVEPTNPVKFLDTLFTPIFRSSTFRGFELIFLKSSTLQMLITLFERFRPTVGRLYMYAGVVDHNWIRETTVTELEDAAKIVELSKPRQLSLVTTYPFTGAEVSEHILKFIANLYIPRVSITFDNLFDNRGTGRGSIPNCRYFECFGNMLHGASALAIPDIVDLVEEWSNNKRDIVHYKLNYFFERMSVVLGKFAKELKERKLPVQLEVLNKNQKFLIKKIATRGHKQNGLRLIFEIGSEVRNRHFNITIIGTNDDDNA